jgi:hypothetical protein
MRNFSGENWGFAAVCRIAFIFHNAFSGVPPVGIQYLRRFVSIGMDCSGRCRVPGIRGIGAVEREERSTPWFLA